jgi:hypothetical protein
MVDAPSKSSGRNVAGKTSTPNARPTKKSSQRVIRQIEAKIGPDALAWASLADEVEPLSRILRNAIATIDPEIRLGDAAAVLSPSGAVAYLAALGRMHDAAEEAANIAQEARHTKRLADAGKGGKA